MSMQSLFCTSIRATTDYSIRAYASPPWRRGGFLWQHTGAECNRKDCGEKGRKGIWGFLTPSLLPVDYFEAVNFSVSRSRRRLMPARDCFLSPALPFNLHFGYADQKRRH